MRSCWARCPEPAGVSVSRLGKVKDEGGLSGGGRTLPVFVLIFTLLSSWIGSGSLLGGAENAYKHGFAALWMAGGDGRGCLLIYFIAPRARKFAQFTIPDLLETRYSQTVRVLGVIAILFAYTAITSYQLIGRRDILHLVFRRRLRPIWAIHRDGVRDRVHGDRGHGVGRVYGCGDRDAGHDHDVRGAPGTDHEVGGWSAVHHRVAGDALRSAGRFELHAAMELMVPTMLLMLGNQAMYQKFFSAKSEKEHAWRWWDGSSDGDPQTVIVALAVVGS